MKKTLAIVLTLALVLCGAAAMADAITLTYAEVNPIEGPIVGDVAILDEDYRDDGLDFTGLSDLLADELYRHFTKTFKQFIT